MKTDLTINLERELWNATHKVGVFGCFEVTIGRSGEERVDYLTYDTKGIWRCYEIKASKKDFYSHANQTFVGHYNYFVMPKDVYGEVKEEIPNHIGIYVSDGRLMCIKRAKRQKLKVDENVLKDSLIRSLYREAEKLIGSRTPSLVESLRKQIKEAKEEAEEYKRKYWDLLNERFSGKPHSIQNVM